MPVLIIQINVVNAEFLQTALQLLSYVRWCAYHSRSGDTEFCSDEQSVPRDIRLLEPFSNKLFRVAVHVSRVPVVAACFVCSIEYLRWRLMSDEQPMDKSATHLESLFIGFDLSVCCFKGDAHEAEAYRTDEGVTNFAEW